MSRSDIFEDYDYCDNGKPKSTKLCSCEGYGCDICGGRGVVPHLVNALKEPVMLNTVKQRLNTVSARLEGVALEVSKLSLFFDGDEREELLRIYDSLQASRLEVEYLSGARTRPDARASATPIAAAQQKP